MTDHALEFLRDRAEKTRDSAGVKLAKTRTAERQIDEQIDLLMEYRGQYRRKMQQAMLEGTSLQRVRDYQAFINSLDIAIDSARNAQNHQRREVERSVKEMSHCQRTLSSFSTVVNRRRDQREEAAQRQERKEQDALATRIHLNGRSGDRHYQGVEQGND